ncbi:MAG: anthranilate synthase component II [Planctomycetota bacterium]|jgi:anthranilate synthase/aminodeoxychorismate synthase-like glutamine amidotransferase
MVVIVDNYDSFTYNLVQRVGELDAERRVEVYRNDAITPEQIEEFKPTHIIISPGPCTPNEAGISMDVVRHFGGRLPLLGVCLGHQAVAQALGGRIERAARLMHGKTSEIHHDGRGVYVGLPNPFVATRYHSLIADRDSLPQEFEVSAWTDRNELMGIRHREWVLEGVQFHPESFLTDHGLALLSNFLAMQTPRWS